MSFRLSFVAALTLIPIAAFPLHRVWRVSDELSGIAPPASRTGSGRLSFRWLGKSARL
jgi:hypothetical protein